MRAKLNGFFVDPFKKLGKVFVRFEDFQIKNEAAGHWQAIKRGKSQVAGG